ncbi:class I SAM-dependent methyltransferase [Acaryochloris sp. IP29b_bin.148]|uniref:class I SAM-dependent DNA methyltransferase n=1 Tax=Acaryochloris sp. IP29b_bin.148 TaxID=2969218 RepID=UPI00260822CB|nr:class I SAM-dependent methyltransferase [Acaryochloris sp. IP29b_bin.148]
MSHWYQPDLAYIHDVGFGDYAHQAAPALLAQLQSHHLSSGLVVDLGCGSGIWAEYLCQADYQVFGVDLSEAMIELARTRIPQAEFRVDSIFTTPIPACQAVTAIGEVLNYLFDSDRNTSRLVPVFQRIFAALTSGGLFIFDIVEPGQVPPETISQSFREGEDWVVLVEKYEDLSSMTLTRRIITFRQDGSFYRKVEEVHKQQLYDSAEIATQLQQIGFQVQVLDHYGPFQLPIARKAVIACKR